MGIFAITGSTVISKGILYVSNVSLLSLSRDLQG
jgi:hypothetical protein